MTLPAGPPPRQHHGPVVVLSLDIDGTMEFGDPPGPIPAAVARELVALGYIVGVASDRPRSGQRPLWLTHGIDPVFVGGKHQLFDVKATIRADRYVHVGDTDVDASYAGLAGFEFVDVLALPTPVGVDAFHRP